MGFTTFEPESLPYLNDYCFASLAVLSGSPVLMPYSAVNAG